MKTITIILAAGLLTGCAAVDRNRWPLEKTVDPVTEEKPDSQIEMQHGW